VQIECEFSTHAAKALLFYAALHPDKAFAEWDTQRLRNRIQCASTQSECDFVGAAQRRRQKLCAVRHSMAVSLKWRKLWDLTEKLKFSENEWSDPQFFLHFKQKYVDIIKIHYKIW
jgi:hypothetical protein